MVVSGRKGSRVPFRLTAGLVLHGPDGRFTAEAEAVARAKSRDGLFYVARKCAACSGWRLRRLS